MTGLAQEYDYENIDDAAFGMYCFWTGEMNLGSIEGVVKTEAGFLDGREVTRVWYHNQALSLDELARQSRRSDLPTGSMSSQPGKSMSYRPVEDITLPLTQFDETRYGPGLPTRRNKLRTHPLHSSN